MSLAQPAQVATHILALLDAAGVRYVVHAHAAVTTIAEARARVPELSSNLLKTVAFAIKDTPRVILAAVAAADDVDYKALAAAVGCNRRDLRLLAAAQVERELGFEVGGLGPFALRPDHAVVIDAGLDASRTVRCGGGLCTRTLELPLSGLLVAGRVSRAAIARGARNGATGV